MKELNEILERILILVRDDPELHDAVVKAIEAWAELQLAAAEHKRALARAKENDYYKGNN